MDTDNTYKQETSSFWLVDDLNNLLLWATKLKASDVELKPGTPIWMRIHGKWQTITKRPLKSEEIFYLMDEITRDRSCAAKVQSGIPQDFSYEIKIDRVSKQGFRGNASACKDGWSIGGVITLRINPSIPPTIKDLEVEQELIEAATPDNGLVLVTGVMGSGKSTLIAALLRHIIETQPRSVSTYEDPIEFDLTTIPNPMGPVTQAEIPVHLSKFAESSRNAARRATDIILYGEARDLETMSGMLESAELGVAAYATVHTRSVAETPARIINKFPDDIQNQVATTLIAGLRLIIQQRLLPRIGGGRIAIKEFLTFDQDMRIQLAKTPIARLIPALEEMLHQKGQPLLVDAQKKFKMGLIHEEDYLKILKEKETSNVA
ncbi:MAG: Flp pilus assembly complex ATPase component [Desulfobacteraceae bacterium]|nr:Flp pilus assembly complex ATPase component [Desulfobacteraceae bacterium]